VRKLYSGVAGDMCRYKWVLLLILNHWNGSPQNVSHSK